MRDLQMPTSKPKIRLLDSAEKLVAENGFDAVSVRDVTEAAKANVAAVNYHFGSREAMMGLVMTRRMQPILQEQLDRLTVVEKKWSGKGVPVEEILESYFRPLVMQSAADGQDMATLGRLCARVLMLGPASLPASLGEAMASVRQRFLKALAKSLPAIAADELDWRLQLLNGAVAAAFLGDQGAAGNDQSVSRLLRFGVAAMREGAPLDKPEQKKGPQATFDF